MKLKQCHIDNFGKFSNWDFSFDNFTNILEDNGFGKTTFATFLSAMFYGFDENKESNLSLSYNRFKPWQGGDYGGLIIFEHNNKRYTVKRCFDEFVDSFSLIDNDDNSIVEYINEQKIDRDNFGNIVFGVNRDGFLRSAFMQQDNICYNGIGESVNDRLIELIYNTTDCVNYDKIIEKIDKSIASLHNKNNNGLLSNAKQEINLLQSKIADCDKLAQTVLELVKESQIVKQDIDIYNASIKQLEKEYKESHTKQLIAEQIAQYDMLIALKQDAEKSINACRELFGILSIDDIYNELMTIQQLTYQVKEKRNAMEQCSNDNYNITQKRIGQIDETTNQKTLENEYVNKQLVVANDELEKLKPKRNFGYWCCGFFSIGIYWLANIGHSCKIRKKRQELLIKKTKLEKERAQILVDINILMIEKHDVLSENLVKQKSPLALEIMDLDHQITVKLDKFFNNDNNQNYDTKLANLFNKFDEYKHSLKQLQIYQTELDKFMLNKDIKTIQQVKDIEQPKDIYSEDFLDIQANTKSQISDEKDALIYKYEQLKSKIDISEQQLKQRCELIEQLDRTIVLKNKFEQQFQALLKTKECLKTAKENLANRYIEPLQLKLKTVVKRYLSNFEVDINSDNDFILLENNTNHYLDFYSKGIKELISVCIRIAMIECLYPLQNKPFLILDDPLSNLDQTKFIQAKSMIKNISSDYQIIYLTCHSSRAL